MTKIVIVNDGQERWAADKSSLIHALDELGWSTTRRLGMNARVEPDDDDVAYTALCNFVEPIEPMPEDANELQTFTWYPAERAWLWS